jgi:GNAT superfamily N-acetyltransferase
VSAAGPFRIEPLCADHDRAQFVSGAVPLDRYFREQASQDIKRRIATCFVALNLETREIAGFYTLTATSIALDALAPEIVKKLPRYPVVPAALLGRLAIAKTAQGKGLGGALLADALMRTARAELGVFAVLVDAKDEAAQRFYERFGFTSLPAESRRLLLPIATALRQIEEAKGGTRK